MAINSRAKGNKAERNTAKLFEKWTGKQFARTPSSGGLNWKSSNSKGDIVCTTEGHYFPFCIEIKNHKEINFEQLILPLKHRKILEFWEQCERDAIKARKIPLLLMRYNGMPKNMFFSVLRANDLFQFTTQKEIQEMGPMITYNSYKEKKSLVVFKITDLFSLEYKTIRKKIKTYLKDIYGTR